MKWRVLVSSNQGTDWLYDMRSNDVVAEWSTRTEAQMAADAYLKYTAEDPFLGPLLGDVTATVETRQ